MGHPLQSSLSSEGMKTLLCCPTLDIIKLLSIDFIFVITGNASLCLPYIILNWFAELGKRLRRGMWRGTKSLHLMSYNGALKCHCCSRRSYTDCKKQQLFGRYSNKTQSCLASGLHGNKILCEYPRRDINFHSHLTIDNRRQREKVPSSLLKLNFSAQIWLRPACVGLHSHDVGLNLSFSLLLVLIFSYLVEIFLSGCLVAMEEVPGEISGQS
ncbi:hypothetical protein YC2023_005243 [Brassica napus]